MSNIRRKKKNEVDADLERIYRTLPETEGT